MRKGWCLPKGILETGPPTAWQIERAISLEDRRNDTGRGVARDECGRFRFYGRLGNPLTHSRDHAYRIGRTRST